MPTYEYECTKGHHFEVVQRITEDPLERCQVCDAEVSRLISATNFILKGSGGYSDGYSSSSSKKGSDDGASSSASTSTSSSESSSKSSSSEGSGSPAGPSSD